MNVQAKLAIEVLTEGWHEMPLRLADAAIRSAKIGDAAGPAHLLARRGLSAAAGEEGQGGGAGRAGAGVQQGVHQAPGTNSVRVRRPAGPGESLADLASPSRA